MSDTLKVRAVPGRTLPREDDSRKYVEGTTEVPNTRYYRRAIAVGDLELVTEKPAPARAPKTEG